MEMLEATGNAIRARFTTMFTAPTSVLTLYDNEPDGSPPAAGEFAKLRIDWADAILAGLGSPRLFRDLGVVTVQIFVPVGTGDGRLLELAGKARAVFQSVTVLVQASPLQAIAFLQPRFQRVGSEGPFYQGNVLARFRGDFTAP